MKNLLNLSGAQKLSKTEQQGINGGHNFCKTGADCSDGRHCCYPYGCYLNAVPCP